MTRYIARTAAITTLLAIGLSCRPIGQAQGPLKLDDRRELQQPAIGDTTVLATAARWQSLPTYDSNNATLFAGLPRLAGNGTTDDTAALQGRLNAVGAAGGGAAIQLPAGTFRINSEVKWPTKNNIALVGAGRDQTTIVVGFGGTPSTAAIGIHISGTLRGVRLANLTVQGLANDDTAAYELLTFTNIVNDVDIENCGFQYSRHASLRFTGKPVGSGLRVINCSFRNHMTAAMTTVDGGAMLGAMNQSQIIGCSFRNCGNSSKAHAAYLNTLCSGVIIANSQFDASDNANTRLHFWHAETSNVQVVGNTFTGSEGPGLVTEYMSGQNMNCVGNSFIYASIRLYPGRDMTIRSCYFLSGNVGTPVIQDSGAVRPTIEDNAFVSDTGSMTNPPAVFAGAGWVVRNNSFYMLGASDTVPAATGCEIAGNRIDYPGYAGSGLIIFRSGTGHKAIDNRINTGDGKGVATKDATGGASGVNVFWRDNEVNHDGSLGGVTTNYRYTEADHKLRSFWLGAIPWLPGHIASTRFVSKAITVTGAATRDFVQVSYDQPLAPGLIVTAQVTAANTVTVTIFNATAAGITAPAGNLAVVVTQKL